jgi:hypothetical protein
MATSEDFISFSKKDQWKNSINTQPTRERAEWFVFNFTALFDATTWRLAAETEELEIRSHGRQKRTKEFP